MWYMLFGWFMKIEYVNKASKVGKIIKKRGQIAPFYQILLCFYYFLAPLLAAILVAKSLPALNFGNFLALILIVSPV